MNIKEQNESLTIFLEGQIRTDNAERLKGEILDVVAKHPTSSVVFDATDLQYISSSGLRILLMVEKLVEQEGREKVKVINLTQAIYEVFKMTGFTKLIDCQRRLYEISVEGREVVGQGQSSTVYRFEDEYIVKLYHKGVPFEKIRQEIRLARQAFIAGIPTALTFSMVKCGDSYGTVFEMVDHADTVGHMLTAHPERFDDIMRKFVATYKYIHQTKVKDARSFTPVKDTWTKWANGMESDDGFTTQEADMLRAMIAAVPERNTMVHCDYHAGNVMYQRDEIIVIDMADIGYGHPIFDLAGGAFHARYSFMPKRQKIHGMCQADMLRFWDTLLRMYFNVNDDKQLEEVKEMCSAFGLLRGAIFPMKHVQIAPEVKAFHVEETRQHLFPRMDWAMEQVEKLKTFF